MNRRIIITGILILANSFVFSQSIHFSQYYNAPMLLNPANTALTPENNYRVGVNYRNQWSAVPVPYNTFSAFADVKILENSGSTSSNWMGAGLAVFTDKAGNGNLSITRFEGSVAYHLSTGSYSMLSGGISAGMVQRSVNYDKLTFDSQWDGFTFNPLNGSNENGGVVKTTYYTMAAGLNLAYFPSDNLYMKFGAGLSNINQPVESFYGQTNSIGMRPLINIDASIRLSESMILNPSVYFIAQKLSFELVYGTLFRLRMPGQQYSSQLILGIYNRFNESLIGVAGVQLGNVQFMGSYDMTISTLAPYNAAYGAMEFSIIYQGLRDRTKAAAYFNCPRFF